MTIDSKRRLATRVPTFDSDLAQELERTSLYQLDPPKRCTMGDVEFVGLSSAHHIGGSKVRIFACDRRGRAKSWTPIYTAQDTIYHADALIAFGGYGMTDDEEKR